MSFDEWIQDEFPGGVEAIRAADMRLAWEAATRQAEDASAAWNAIKAAMEVDRVAERAGLVPDEDVRTDRQADAEALREAGRIARNALKAMEDDDAPE